MQNKTSHKAITATVFSLAAFLFSCSSDDNNIGSETKYAYCVLSEQKMCLEGPFASCQGNGLPSNTCPFDNSQPTQNLPYSSSTNLLLSSSSFRSSSSNNLQSSSSLNSSSSNFSSSSNNASNSSLSSGSSSSSITIISGTFVDSRDDQTYRWVEIGEQIWMAENLKYNASGSKCFNNQDSYCDMYGLFYDWAVAVNLESNCNSTRCASKINTNHQGICPDGWHIPSKAEWDLLIHYIREEKSCPYCDAKHLKSISGWNKNGDGLDSYGFAALPGGYSNYDGAFSTFGFYGYWWTASEYREFDLTGDYAYDWYMVYNDDGGFWESSFKSTSRNVRCVKD